MPVQTRHTRHSQTAHHFVQLPQKNVRNVRIKVKLPGEEVKQSSNEVFYSDEEISRVKEESKVLEEPKELEVEPQEDDDVEIKNEDVAKTCRPPPRRGKRGRKPNLVISGNLNLRSRQIVSELNKICPNPLEVKVEVEESAKVKPKRGRKAVSDSIDLMLPEENTVQPTVILQQKQQKKSPLELQLEKAHQERERRRLLEEQMELLAKIDSEQTALLGGPFLVYGQYRPAIESKTDVEYRQFLKKNQSQGGNMLRQRINFSLARQKEIRRELDAETIEKQKDLFFSYRQLEDYLFYKCKEMDQQELAEYKWSAQYKETLLKLIKLHPYNSYKLAKPKRKSNLQIASAVSQKFLFTNARKENNSQRASLYRPTQKLSEQQSYSSKAYNSSQAIQQKNSELSNIKIQNQNQPCQSQVNNGPSPFNILLAPKQQNRVLAESQEKNAGLSFDFFKQSPEILEQKKKELRKRFEERGQKFVEPVQTDMSKVDYDREKILQNIKSDVNAGDYNRDKILQIIQSVNEKSNFQEDNFEQKNSRPPSEKVLSQASKSKTASLKSQAITASNKPASKQLSQISNHSQVLSTFEINQPKFQGLEQIEIITRRSGEKTQQTTRHDRSSTYNSRNEVKSTRYTYNQNWELFNRGPKVKRLQILNRFHYNPFELQNGDDQCDLWRRLMSEEIDDLKSHYKYEEPNEYFLSQNQKYEKGYVLPLKVKEQDFYVQSLYDSETRALKEEIQYVSQALGSRYQEEGDRIQSICNNEGESYKEAEQLSVKRETNDYDGFAFTIDGPSQKPICQFQEQNFSDLKQRTTQEPKSPTPEKEQQEPRLDQSGKSFNFDLLQGFQIPELTCEKQPQKVIQLDFF